MGTIPFVKNQQLNATTKNLRDIISDPNSRLNTPQEQFPNKAETFSYSGSDVMCLMFIPDQQNGAIKASGFIQIEDSLQTLTVSSARSVSPVRRLGETSPTAYTRGSRTIAGSMVFTVGLRDAFVKALTKSIGDGEPLHEPTLFVDQIPKFSMFLQATNELGGVSTAMLVNITLTNFGTTFSIDDIYTESTFTYVAEQYFPLSITKNTSNMSEIAKAIREISKIFNVKELTIDSLMDQFYGRTSLMDEFYGTKGNEIKYYPQKRTGRTALMDEFYGVEGAEIQQYPQTPSNIREFYGNFVNPTQYYPQTPANMREFYGNAQSPIHYHQQKSQLYPLLAALMGV